MMEKLTQEESESMIDRAITWFENIAETCSMLTPGNVSHKAAALKGKAIRAAEWLTKKRKQSSDDSISIHTDCEGVKWVRVKIFDEDFFIAAKDYEEEGEIYFSWKKAVEIGTFSKKQAYLIAAYKEEINKLLEEIGGDPLASGYWSSTEGSSGNAWYVYFGSGYVIADSKYNSYVVRPCIQIIKKVRENF